jgi:hypothetical protein
MKEIIEIPLSKLVTDKANPRDGLEEIDELADSIEANGQQEPLKVEDLGDSTFLIVEGHRRKAAFEVLKKRQKKEQLVQCVVDGKLSPDERLLKRCVIEFQHKSWSGPARDKAWNTLWKKHKGDKNSFAKKLGTNIDMIDQFLDRMGLDKELKTMYEKGDISQNMINETKGLDEEDRKQLLKRIGQDGIGRQEVREIMKVAREATPTVKEALLKGEIDADKAERLSGLSEERQKSAIFTAQVQKEQFDSVVKEMEKPDFVEKKKTDKKAMTAAEFVNKLNIAISDSLAQNAAIRGILQQIEEEELTKYLTPAMKKTIRKSLNDWHDETLPTVKVVKETVEAWK